MKERTIEVLALFASGLQLDEVATQLEVSRTTVERALLSAKRELMARTRTHAVAVAVARGIVEMEGAR